MHAYVALDFSPAMHELAAEHLGELASRVTFVTRDFRVPAWPDGLGAFDAAHLTRLGLASRHRRTCRRVILPTRTMRIKPWLRCALVVVFGWIACTKTQHVNVPVASEPAASCAETCAGGSSVNRFQCLRRCPGATISDGECDARDLACEEREVISGRAVAITAGVVVALPLLAFFTWYVVLDAGPTD